MSMSKGTSIEFITTITIDGRVDWFKVCVRTHFVLLTIKFRDFKLYQTYVVT